MNPSTSFFIFLSWSIGYHPYPNKSLDEMKIRVNACSGTLPSAKKCRDPGLIPIAETLLHLLFFYLLPYPFDFGKIKKYEIVLAQSSPRINRGVQKMQETTLVRDELQSQIHFKKGCFCVRV